MIKKLAEHSEIYDREREYEDMEEEFEARGRGGRRNRGRYSY